MLCFCNAPQRALQFFCKNGVSDTLSTHYPYCCGMFVTVVVVVAVTILLYHLVLHTRVYSCREVWLVLLYTVSSILISPNNLFCLHISCFFSSSRGLVSV